MSPGSRVGPVVPGAGPAGGPADRALDAATAKATHLGAVQDEVPERTPAREARLHEMAARRAAGDPGPHFARSARWIEGPGART